MMDDDEKDLVSVIIPCYNQTHWLHDAIHSVFASTYANTEVIVIDDGSTEGDAASVVKDFPKDRVRLIRQENQGVCYARDNAIQEANGDYILTLDADDILEVHFIERAMNVFRTLENVAQVGGNYALICGGVVTEKQQDIPEGIVTDRIMANNYIPNTYVFRRSAWERVGGFAKSLNRLAMEDVDFTMSFHDHVMNTYLLSDIAVFYRQHGVSRNRNNPKRLMAKGVILMRHIRWFLCHPRFILPFAFWNKCGWLVRGFPQTK